MQSETAPVPATTTTLWYDTVGGRSYVYYDNSWVDANPAVEPSTATIDLSAVAQDIVPAIDSFYDLGSPSHQWKSLYVSTNTIYIGNVPLTVDTLTNTLLVNGAQVTGGGGGSTFTPSSYGDVLALSVVKDGAGYKYIGAQRTNWIVPTDYDILEALPSGTVFTVVLGSGTHTFTTTSKSGTSGTNVSWYGEFSPAILGTVFEAPSSITFDRVGGGSTGNFTFSGVYIIISRKNCFAKCHKRGTPVHCSARPVINPQRQLWHGLQRPIFNHLATSNR
jgi:hypothetical protein